MQGLTNYRIAFAIDMYLLWNRKGGLYCQFALVVALILWLSESTDEIMTWVLPVSLLLALASAFWAIRGCTMAYQVWKNGVESEGVVERIEKSTGEQSSSTRRFNTRIRFSYSVGGVKYEGTSTWGSPGRTGVLAVSQRIPIFYAPSDPSIAFWQEDLPISFPPVNF